MAVIDYPSTLPGPNQVMPTPKVRARNSGLPGSQGYTAPERDYYGTLDVSFFLTRDQATIFKAWWDSNGGYWFNATWPRLSQSLSVYRILGAPTFNHTYDGAYRIRAKVELRGASLAVKMGCTDGPTWASMTLVSRPHNSVAFGGGRFVVGDIDPGTGNATASWSTNGVSWTPAASVISSSGFSMRVSFGNGIFYASINAIKCATSTDGNTWVSRSHSSHFSESTPWFGGGTFIQPHAVNATTLATADGVTFVTGTTPGVNYSASGGCFGAGVHVAWGTVGICYSLDNGATWSAGNAPFTWLSLYDIAYGNGRFVGVGSGGTSSSNYIHSTDGINWTQATLPLSRIWRSVIYADRSFLVCAESTFSSQLLTSPDGLNWAVSPNTFLSGAGYTHLCSNNTGVYVAISALNNSIGEVGQC